MSKRFYVPRPPPGWGLVLVPTGDPPNEPDWEECIRQAEVATGLKVERATMGIVIREVRRWIDQCVGTPLTSEARKQQREACEQFAREHMVELAHDLIAMQDGYEIPRNSPLHELRRRCVAWSNELDANRLADQLVARVAFNYVIETADKPDPAKREG